MCGFWEEKDVCMAFKTLSLDDINKGVSVVNKEDQGLSPETFQLQEDRDKRRNPQRRMRKKDH